LPRYFDIFQVDSGKRFGNHLVRDGSEFLDERLRLCGDMKPPGTTVGGIGNPFNQRSFFEPVNDPRQRNWLDVEHVGKLDLAKAGLSFEAEQDLPLGAGNAHAARTAIEGFAEGVRGFTDLKGKSFHEQPI
jgi:hypothetical protein